MGENVLTLNIKILEISLIFGDVKMPANRPRPISAKPAEPEKNYLFFNFLKDYLSLCLPISIHETYCLIYFVLSNN
jgi:hypothetical protein